MSNYSRTCLFVILCIKFHAAQFFRRFQQHKGSTVMIATNTALKTCKIKNQIRCLYT